MTPSFSPRDSLLQVYRRWWLIACLGILGGLAGWLIHKTQPAIYQSSVAFAVTIDTAQTGPLKEREQDRLQQAFANVFYSQAVLDATLSAASERDVRIDRPMFFSVASHEWRVAVWEFFIRHPDPAVAQTLAEVWGQTATGELRTALERAQEAQVLQSYITALVTCSDEFADSEAPADCTLPVYEDIEQTIASLSAERDAALSQSRSLIPAMAFEQTQTAELPAEPVTSGQAQIVFFSAIIGIVVGIWLVNLPPRDSSRFKS